jgi:hypothetical protein
MPTYKTLVADLCVIESSIRNSSLPTVFDTKVSGSWRSDNNPQYATIFPISLHFSAYPEDEIIPALGETLRVTIERL